MEKLPVARRVTRLPTLIVLGVIALVGGWFIAPESRSQAAPATAGNTDLAPLLANLKAQQDQIVANQTKIEAQTALLKEEIRQVKIYSARGGSGRR